MNIVLHSSSKSNFDGRPWSLEITSSVHSPDDEIDLLIDNVLREDAESVVVLLPASRPNVGNRAGDLGWEDGAHGVDLE